LAEQQVELTEAIAVGIPGLVLQPQKLAGDVLVAAQLLVDPGPVRLRPPGRCGRRKQRRFQHNISAIANGGGHVALGGARLFDAGGERKD